MTKLKIKSYTTSAGNRTTARLDAVTWKAIDTLAADYGLTWEGWINTIPQESKNRHTEIRAAVITALLDQQFPRERAEGTRNWGSALLTAASTMDDEQLREKMERGSIETGPIDFGGFLFLTGQDVYGKACVWIGNGMRDIPHVAIPLPMSMANLSQAGEAA